MADKIEVNYAELQRIAGGFSQGADQVDSMIQKIKAGYENLRSTWEGRGATAFFKEMDELVFPSLNKLKAALTQANQTTNQVASLFEQAESEASGLFNQD